MEFRDYYASLGVDPGATPEEVKRSYRKLARKFHPDVSKAPDAEVRFKEIAEAYRALKDPEKRAAYDEIARRYRHGQNFEPPPGWTSGFEFTGRGPADREDGSAQDAQEFSEFFASLFGRQGAGERRHRDAFDDLQRAGRDRHAKMEIVLEDAFRGARRTIALQSPVADPQGRVRLQERQLDVLIPKGVRPGQHLRLAGQGDTGTDGQGAGDLYLEVVFLPHAIFRVDGRDCYLDLPLAPWEAALGTTVDAPTPDGRVALTIPPGSAPGRKLRLKGRGIPGTPPGDLYANLQCVLPPADSPASREAYTALQGACPGFDPRPSWLA